jgi:Leucine-rich repeat (LRR) protein
MPKSELRWLHPTPGRLIFTLLPVEAVLLLFNWLGWTPKGWAVSGAIAAVALTIVVLMLWFSAALLFRRRFQFSIRSLLLLTATVALPFSWLAAEMKWAREQKEAVEALIKLGGHVTYAYEVRSLGYSHHYQDPSPPGPAWLRHLLGDDFFTDVSFVRVSGFRPYISDSDLDHLKRLSHVREISFDGSIHVTDAGLERLSGLSQLEVLDVTRTQITDAGLKHIEGLKQLQWLNLEDTQVTDVGLAHIKGLHQLQVLHLNSTKITDVGLESLGELIQLQELEVGRTQITDAGLDSLKRLNQLRRLDLQVTRISDAGLAHLKGMTQLQDLNLRKTAITDEGLDHIQRLNDLQRIDLNETKVTETGVSKLQKTLPNLQIINTVPRTLHIGGGEYKMLEQPAPVYGEQDPIYAPPSIPGMPLQSTPPNQPPQYMLPTNQPQSAPQASQQRPSSQMAP